MFNFFAGFLFNVLFDRRLGSRTSAINAHANRIAYFSGRKRIIRAKNGTHGNGMSLLVQLDSFYGNYFHRLRHGVWTIILFISILWLCLKTRRVFQQCDAISDKFAISSELVILPERLCWAWTATRNQKLRKFNGINFQIARKTPHVVFCILLVGDVATNPGPFVPPTKTMDVSPDHGKFSGHQTKSLDILYLNSRSLNAFVPPNVNFCIKSMLDVRYYLYL